MKKNYLDIVDPIHDFIRVYDHELKIIDNPIFQRLRRIRQLSGAHLTYPAAQHTRFEHSLGVMHIASQAGQALNEKGILKSYDIEVLRLSGLLHDIGHGPFSHLFEEIIQQKKFSHEDFGKEIILKSSGGLFSFREAPCAISYSSRSWRFLFWPIPLKSYLARGKSISTVTRLKRPVPCRRTIFVTWWSGMLS